MISKINYIHIFHFMQKVCLGGELSLYLLGDGLRYFACMITVHSPVCIDTANVS